MGKSTAATCEVCGVQINRRVDLRRHMKVHAENKEDLKHPCPFPGCTFKSLQKSNLVSHMNTHTGARPYKCQTGECKFRTSDRSSLIRHRKDLHGYVPNSRAKARTRNASEAEKPSTSSSTPGGSILPVGALPDEYKTPLPELPPTLGPCSPLAPPTDCTISNDSKSCLVALRTDVFVGYTWVNNEQYLHVDSKVSSPSPGPLMSDEVPMLGYTQVSATEEGNVQDINLPAQPIPEQTSSRVSSGTSDGVFVRSDDLETSYDAPFPPSPTSVYDGSGLPALPPSNTVYNDFIPSNDSHHIVDNTPTTSGSQFVGGYDPATSLLPGYDSTLNKAGYEPCGAGLFDFENSSFAALGDLGDLDQMFACTLPFGSMYPDDQSPVEFTLDDSNAS